MVAATRGFGKRRAAVARQPEIEPLEAHDAEILIFLLDGFCGNIGSRDTIADMIS